LHGLKAFWMFVWVICLPLCARQLSAQLPNKRRRAVGRESEAHPAFRIIPSPDAERYHLPPIQGYKYRFDIMPSG